MSAHGNCILLYDSIHDVMRVEKVLKAESIWCDLIPTPRQLSSECGMSLEIRGSNLTNVSDLLADDDVQPRIFRVVSGNFKPV